MTSQTRGVVAMTLSNIAALMATIFGYLVYSKVMTPAEFGLYAGALAIAKLGTTLLDGGIKTAIIKSSVTPSQNVLSALFLGGVVSGLVVTLVGAGALAFSSYIDYITIDDALFLFWYAAAYFLTYPLLLQPLAKLERERKFSPLALIEGVCNTIEYAMPAALWLLVGAGFWTFLLAVWTSRLIRTVAVICVGRQGEVHRSLSRPDWRGSRAILKDGTGLQLTVLLSMVRDTLHLSLVGPFFGREWAGFYAWALQLCGVASQVFVQTASRVALPNLLHLSDKNKRWAATREQVVWLCIFTATPLVFLLDAARIANAQLFDSKWDSALIVIPFIAVRMLPGMATTPLGALLLVDQGTRKFLMANLCWTLCEVVSALIFLLMMGPLGLAWSYSFMAWVGLSFFVAATGAPANFWELTKALLFRPALLLPLLLVLVFHFTVHSIIPHEVIFLTIVSSAVAFVLGLVAESRVRNMIFKGGV